MKKISALAAAVLFSALSFAQSSEAILSTIEKAPHGKRAVQFREERKGIGESAKTVTLEGDLFYDVSESYVSMLYTNKDVFIIDGDKMTITRDGNSSIFDTSKNIMMKGLKNVLLNSFAGKPSVFAAEQNATIKAERNGSDYVVTVAATKKAPRGYSRIIVKYRCSDCAIVGMLMEEVTGAVTSYFIK